jgi:predicted nuclease of predicted toxin-antitoxin system
MKLLLDEMYADIVEYASKHDLVLVTQDQKPAELAELTGVKCVLVSSGMIAKIADAKIKEKYAET